MYYEYVCIRQGWAKTCGVTHVSFYLVHKTCLKYNIFRQKTIIYNWNVQLSGKSWPELIYYVGCRMYRYKNRLLLNDKFSIIKLHAKNNVYVILGKYQFLHDFTMRIAFRFRTTYIYESTFFLIQSKLNLKT